jgi:S1-C subfamily serine protease
MNPGEGQAPGGSVPAKQPQSRPGDYSAPGIGEGSQTPMTSEPAQAPPAPGPPILQQPPESGGYQPPAAPVAPGVQYGPTDGTGMGGRTPPPGTIPPAPPAVQPGPPRRRWGGTVLTAIVAGLVGALVVLLVLPAIFGVNPYDLVRGKVRKTVVDQETNQPKQVTNIVSPTQGATDVSGVAKKVTPSVVNIDVRTTPQTTNPFSLTPQEGTGSGVIYTSDGYIITNNHVVSGAQDITVTLASGTELKGKKVGADPDNDIAVVKVDQANLPAIDIGNSDNLVVGQLVVAVGSPLGFEQTVTAGIVSALHRVVGVTSSTGQSTNMLTDLIQTDATINPGNSGGALCDGSARLVGINALIASQSGGSEGIGFAIPIDTAKMVADDLIAGRPVSHPYVGILGQTVSQSIAQRYNLPVDAGAYVTRVVPGSPADKAGIKAGDIIVGIDGKPVKSMDDVLGGVRTHHVGEKVSITYYSGGSKKTVELTLAEKPSTVPQQ